jgi:type II secretory pathway component PulM
VKVTKRDRKVILIGAVVLLVITVVYFGVLPLVDLVREIETEKSDREAELIRMAEAIRQKEYLRQSLSHLKSSEDSLRALLLEGDDPTVVTSELHRLVNTMAEQQGIAVTRIDASTKPERFDTETIKKNPLMAGFLKIRVRASLKCTPDKLAQMLAALENQPKFLIVERLEIRAWNVRPDKEINPDIVVATYVYKPEAPAPKPARPARPAATGA